MQSTSTYYKIRDILTEASTEARGISELAEEIHGKYDSLTYYRKDSSGGVQRHPCSTAVIRKKIRFCIDLGLISDEKSCILTESGRSALDENRFDLVLQQALLSFLERNQVPWSTIETAIERLPLPDASSLYRYLKPGLSESSFRTCLFLLSQCGESIGQNILISYQKKLYLTEGKEAEIRDALSQE